MTEYEALSQIASLAQQFGLWVLFAWLFANERSSHQETRQKWIDDLREISGLKPTLRRDSQHDNETSP
jgi:hypothetical protein